MVELSATAYFWFITLGLLIGYVFGQMMKNEGIALGANILWGIIGAVLTGTFGVIFGLGDGLLFATAGTLAILYLVNVFHLHHQEDIFGHVDREIHLNDDRE